MCDRRISEEARYNKESAESYESILQTGVDNRSSRYVLFRLFFLLPFLFLSFFFSRPFYLCVSFISLSLTSSLLVLLFFFSLPQLLVAPLLRPRFLTTGRVPAPAALNVVDTPPLSNFLTMSYRQECRADKVFLGKTRVHRENIFFPS